VGHAGLLMQHLVLRIGKKVQKTGRILRYIFIAFLNRTCGPDLVWVQKWHLKMKI
jgi:hypothetical protein